MMLFSFFVLAHGVILTVVQPTADCLGLTSGASTCLSWPGITSLSFTFDRIDATLTPRPVHLHCRRSGESGSTLRVLLGSVTVFPWMDPKEPHRFVFDATSPPIASFASKNVDAQCYVEIDGVGDDEWFTVPPPRCVAPSALRLADTVPLGCPCHYDLNCIRLSCDALDLGRKDIASLSFCGAKLIKGVYQVGESVVVGRKGMERKDMDNMSPESTRSAVATTSTTIEEAGSVAQSNVAAKEMEGSMGESGTPMGGSMPSSARGVGFVLLVLVLGGVCVVATGVIIAILVLKNKQRSSTSFKKQPEKDVPLDNRDIQSGSYGNGPPELDQSDYTTPPPPQVHYGY